MFEMEQDEDLAELWCICGQRIVQPKPPPSSAGSRRASSAAVAAGKITPTPVTFKRSKTGTIKVRFSSRVIRRFSSIARGGRDGPGARLAGVPSQAEQGARDPAGSEKAEHPRARRLV